MDRKGSRKNNRRASRPKKRVRPRNRHEIEQEEASTISSAKKLKSTSYNDITVEAVLGYRILNFITVFSAISDYVKCKSCGGDVKFLESSIRGLGFKIVIQCDSCDPRRINSCPVTDNHSYEINRRITFAMRVLGIGFSGIQKFCGLMDLPKPVFQSTYDSIVQNICCAAQAVCEISLKKAAKEEKDLTAQSEENFTGLTVFGNGTWRKTDFSSLSGVASIIGHYTGKVIDIITKSAYCKACEVWTQKADTEEYKEWQESHECSANNKDNAGKLEIDGIREMFKRSEELYGVKYMNYIGDGDSETFKGVIESNPYDVPIKKKECVFHLQKRMRTRFRDIKGNTKGLGEKEKLTGKLIDELTDHYGLAIRNNCHSTEGMKRDIWATFFHKISTDKKPQHQNYPPGENSWCSWQRAKAENKLEEYTHKPALHEDIENAIRPVYEEFSDDNLLERCLGGFEQSDNEYLNALIWKIAPKSNFDDCKIREIATYIAASTINEGTRSLIDILQIMNVKIGFQAYTMAENEDTASKQMYEED